MPSVEVSFSWAMLAESVLALATVGPDPPFQWLQLPRNMNDRLLVWIPNFAWRDLADWESLAATLTWGWFFPFQWMQIRKRGLVSLALTAPAPVEQQTAPVTQKVEDTPQAPPPAVVVQSTPVEAAPVIQQLVQVQDAPPPLPQPQETPQMQEMTPPPASPSSLEPVAPPQTIVPVDEIPPPPVDVAPPPPPQAVEMPPIVEPTPEPPIQVLTMQPVEIAPPIQAPPSVYLAPDVGPVQPEIVQQVEQTPMIQVAPPAEMLQSVQVPLPVEAPAELPPPAAEIVQPVIVPAPPPDTPPPAVESDFKTAIEEIPSTTEPATRETVLPEGVAHDASDDTLKSVQDISAASSMSDVNAEDGPTTQEQATSTEGPAEAAPNPPFGSISETDANQEKKVATKRIQANGAMADSMQ